jgi:hypothetical protein
MNATLHTLHPGQAAQCAPDAPAGQILQALEQMASSIMVEQLGVMFENADTLLFEMAEKAGKSGQQSFMDAMRIVRVQRPRMVKAFQDALHAALRRKDDESSVPNVDLDDLDSWSLQDSSDLEEKLAVNNMVAKVSSMYTRELAELEQRMAQLSEQAKGSVSPQALSGGRILEAFQCSMKELDLQLPIKLVIYKLFDLTVLSRLGTVFTGANQMLDANGLKALPKPAKKSPVKRPSLDHLSSMQLPAAAPVPAAPAPPALPAHHPQFAAALQAARAVQGSPPLASPGQAFAATPASAMPYAGVPSYAAPASYVPSDPHANSQLATEMLALMEAVGQGRPVESWMPTQNLSLVGRMFDDMYTDSRLNEAARPMLGRLQFPVMKVALADPSFFSNPAHPVRSLVNDVFDTLTTDGAASGADLHRLEELIQELLKRFDLDPARLRKPAQQMVAVTEADAEKFLTEQQRRIEEQEKALRAKIRRIVVQELRLHLADRHVPQPCMKLLLSGLGPMMAIHYRHGGPGSPEWQRALKLLDRVLASFDPLPLPPQERAQLEAELQADVYSELAGLGMPSQKVDALVERLREAHEDFAAELAARPAAATDAPALAATGVAATPIAAAVLPAPPVASGQSALHMLLIPGEWFRVWEAKAKSCRWLKLVNHYESHDCVVFEDFAGDNRLQMKAAVFGHDLAAGRSVPVNPSPVTTELIRQLPAPPAEPVDPCASWLSNQPAAQRAA